MFSETQNDMKVKWTEFDCLGYDLTRETFPEANPQDFEKEYLGEVIETYKPLFGVPKFVVALPDGVITTVKMDVCRIVQEDCKTEEQK